jgi:hypothetical protein
MDEPELSFVSYHTNNSNRSSPNTSVSIRTSATTQNASAGGSTISSSTSGCNSELSNQNLSLIHMQQKQLNKQFCNMSPIDQNLSAHMNNIKSQLTLSGTISFENQTQTRTCSYDQEEDDEEEVDTCSKQSSFILLSPNKIYNEKTGSLIHGLGLLESDGDEDHTSASLIESQLNFGPCSFTSMNNLKGFQPIKEPTQSSLGGSTTTNAHNMLTCVTSFEQHEHTSTSHCYNLTNEFTTLSNNTTNSNISKLLSSVKSKIEQSKSEYPNFNSTPLIAIRKLPAFNGSDSAIFKQEANQDESLADSTTLSQLSREIKNLNCDDDDDHTEFENLNSHEMSDMTMTSQN